MRYICLLFMIIFASSMHIFLYRAGILPVLPSESVIPLFFGLSILTFNPVHYVNCFKTHTFKFLLVYLVLTAIFSFSPSVSIEVITSTIANSVITLLFYVFSYAFFSSCNTKLISWTLLISLIILGLSIWYDTFIGLDKLDDGVRKGGFAANPNTAASAVKFLGLAILLLFRNSKLKPLLLLGLVSTVFITFSRSGILLLIIIIVLLIANQWQINFNIKAEKVFATGAKLILVFSISYLIVINLATFLQKEIPEFAQGDAGVRVNYLTGKGVSKTEYTNSKFFSSRQGIAQIYASKFIANPYGHGAGYTSDRLINTNNTHNYYLKLAVDFGIFGLILLIVFLVQMVKKAIKTDHFYYLVFAIILALEFFTSHYVLMEKTIIIVLAFMDYTLFNKAKITEETQEQKATITQQKPS